jgi:hypothetical protein
MDQDWTLTKLPEFLKDEKCTCGNAVTQVMLLNDINPRMPWVRACCENPACHQIILDELRASRDKSFNDAIKRGRKPGFGSTLSL